MLDINTDWTEEEAVQAAKLAEEDLISFADHDKDYTNHKSFVLNGQMTLKLSRLSDGTTFSKVVPIRRMLLVAVDHEAAMTDCCQQLAADWSGCKAVSFIFNGTVTDR